MVRQNNEGTGTVSIWIRWRCFVRPREIGGPLGFEAGIPPSGCHRGAGFTPGIYAGLLELTFVAGGPRSFALAATVHGRDTL